MRQRELTQVSWSLPMPKQDTFARINVERPQRARGQPPVSRLSNPVIVEVAPKRERRRSIVGNDACYCFASTP